MKMLPALAALLLAGCIDQQSALAPHGEGARRIAELSWLLFGICSFVFLLVLIACWLAIRGGARLRSRLADPRLVIWGGIAIPVAVLTFLLAYSVLLMRVDAQGAKETPVLRVHVSGEQWWWRVHYERPDGTRFESANEIRIPAGAEIEFVLSSPDVIHSFWVPSLGGKVDMIPGRTTRMRAKAERAGIFRGQCAEYCGGPHALMSLTVHALAPEEFDRWLEREAANAAIPADNAAMEGEKLFRSAGCGGCHSVRGTEAGGAIGPDLTHYGSRKSLGAEILPMSAENTARFIAHGQTIKPGNRMPQFAIFSRDELAALSAYLVGLR